MENHRRADEYYYDEYDRRTIADLKEKEQALIGARKLYVKAVEEDEKDLVAKYVALNRRFIDAGVEWARSREMEVKNRMAADERKDGMVKRAKVPENIRCGTCGEEMFVELSDFIDESYDLVFFFACPAHHAPRRAVYANRREYVLPESRCGHCKGRVSSKKKKSRNKIIFTDTCLACGKVDKRELVIGKRKVLPIEDAERQKYCIDFIGRRSFTEDLQALVNIKLMADAEMPGWKEGDLGEERVVRPEMLNVAALEQRLTGELEKSGFVKLQFEKPKTGRFLTMGFSVQDSGNRDADQSIKKIKQLISGSLLLTNWRLMSGLECTLGYLTGQLKGYSNGEDLNKLAQELSAKKRGL
ncbi:hypothetical protein OC25_03595 [Pedobacter kyungheensis]|uniref:Uncharacterized protein n=1 Tax=Pedobacter kyungheensis TaxID=1069985 RepID=A0A0C1DEX0_9SPHI|nr:hypothetical protein [Pedobacter kyungheensis]KIA96181.1 hypothetical protein OC25_03595 [Pedobacter kyungheensis]